MIWLSLKVSEYSGMLSARYTPGTAHLSESDLTSLQMLCRSPSWATFCILRSSHIQWSERAQAWWKRGCEGLPGECRAPGLRCSAPAPGGGSLDSQNVGQRGDHPSNTVTVYSLLLEHRERHHNSISNYQVAVKKELLHDVALETEDVKAVGSTFLC